MLRRRGIITLLGLSMPFGSFFDLSLTCFFYSFGKFVRIAFGGDGSIAGASIDWYLLEKSRVVARSEVERSFHVFYMLVEGSGGLRGEQFA